MLSGIGWGKHEDAHKDIPSKGDRVVILVATITVLEWEVPQYLL